jgi:hypothetical protein
VAQGEDPEFKPQYYKKSKMVRAIHSALGEKKEKPNLGIDGLGRPPNGDDT